MDEKQQRWDQIEASASTIVDALGHPIDSGILPLVVALNVLGIRTVASCQGHLDHGTGAPYVDIEAETDDEEEKRIRRLFHSIAEEEECGQYAPDLIDARYQEAFTLQREAGHEHLVLRSQLTEYLSEFYATRQVPYNQRLVIQGIIIQDIGCPMRLESQGAGLQALADSDTRVFNLTSYQEEMNAFAVFLKECYFTSH